MFKKSEAHTIALMETDKLSLRRVEKGWIKSFTSNSILPIVSGKVPCITQTKKTKPCMSHDHRFFSWLSLSQPNFLGVVSYCKIFFSCWITPENWSKPNKVLNTSTALRRAWKFLKIFFVPMGEFKCRLICMKHTCCKFFLSKTLSHTQ